ncbi:hypothetical protein TTHERM_000266261 (macronuclear) [Tetrahymena thermophila SB210]|uniref:Uncharacterized protein n=1 Tax=Tetrahymena thermophila (strain SB210) TaxID=312017 RepID=W7XCT7_TETTS|nr:hypothetical protein TTHERM_000266261 [Tetrahymena thermophila SB210]EWS74373.1 hypothetical protein TTHERM_000266261 [Tetrahymena thermophila SB210]|eukprot:XP_012653050.1 hypothetical protein TTHERM_000266261 [Tetrahymena thermophila SB210]
MERDLFVPKKSLSQQFSHSLNIYKTFQDLNKDQDDLLVEDVDYLIQEKCCSQNLIEENNNETTTMNSSSNQNNIIKIFFSKSQKKQKKQFLQQFSNNNSSESIKKENIVFQQLIKDSDSQYLTMSQEFDENINDQENQIELELQIQNSINYQSDPILVIDDSNQPLSQHNVLVNREQLNLKRPFFKLEKENQFINTLNLPKSQNKIVKKDIVSKEILEEKKVNPNYKRNIQSIQYKYTQFQKKQLKISEKQNVKSQRVQNECLKLSQNHFNIRNINDIEIQQ